MQAGIASATAGMTPARSAATATQDILRKLQSLHVLQPLVNGKAPVASPGSQLRMEVSLENASAIKEAVRRGAGPCSRGILRHLQPVVSALEAGGIKVGPLALTTLTFNLPKMEG